MYIIYFVYIKYMYTHRDKHANKKKIISIYNAVYIK